MNREQKWGEEMKAPKHELGRVIVTRLRHDSELVRSITELAREKGIKNAIFTVIGAMKQAKLGYYDQEKHKYLSFTLETPHELVSCVGNISPKDGEPFAHLHGVFADKEGSTKAGHVIKAIVFAAELHLQELVGPELVRVHDETTGLSLWRV